MHAIVLVGGFGTRLRSVLPDTPKPMAPIHGKPFLAYLLAYLKTQGITQVIFPVHYMAEKFSAYFQSEYAGISIQYVAEEQPLGTGGAIVNALTAYTGREPVFVLNGDTFVKLDYPAMYTRHLESGADITMALRSVDDCCRYGKVVTENNRIVEFKEKGEQGPGFINAGVYLIQPDLFARHKMPAVFSFEKDFMYPCLEKINAQAFAANDYFIDIGIPEDYSRAVSDLGVLEI
jgi:D-glycero-alpha-D-manno-heptose 1-phosphate guanylyltransferase